MMGDLTPYRFEQHEGRPPDGEPGQFFGFDARGNACILRWHEGKWHGVRMVDEPRLLPEAFVLTDDTADRVVSWAFAPAMWDEAPPPKPKLQVVPSDAEGLKKT